MATRPGDEIPEAARRHLGAAAAHLEQADARIARAEAAIGSAPTERTPVAEPPPESEEEPTKSELLGAIHEAAEDAIAKAVEEARAREPSYPVIVLPQAAVMAQPAPVPSKDSDPPKSTRRRRELVAAVVAIIGALASAGAFARCQPQRPPAPVEIHAEPK